MHTHSHIYTFSYYIDAYIYAYIQMHKDTTTYTYFIHTCIPRHSLGHGVTHTCTYKKHEIIKAYCEYAKEVENQYNQLLRGSWFEPLEVPLTFDMLMHILATTYKINIHTHPCLHYRHIYIPLY